MALIARDAASLEETAAEMEAIGARALAIGIDVADADAVFAAAEEVEEKLGPIDVWVNNAMATVFAPVADATPEECARSGSALKIGKDHLVCGATLTVCCANGKWCVANTRNGLGQFDRWST